MSARGVTFGTSGAANTLHDYQGGSSGLPTAGGPPADRRASYSGGEVMSEEQQPSSSALDDELRSGGDSSRDTDESSSQYTGTSGTGSSATVDSANVMKIKSGLKCLRKVPFEIQVIVVLMIPVLFLISFTGKNLGIAVEELNYVETKHGLMAHMTEFERDLMLERSRLGLYYAAKRTTNITLQNEAWVSFRDAKELTDKEWVVLQHEISPFATEDPAMSRVRDRLVEAMSYIKLNRENVLQQRVSSTLARKNYTEIITQSQGILRAMTKHKRIGHSLHSIVVIINGRFLINYFGAVQATGNEIVSTSYDWTHDAANLQVVRKITAEYAHELANTYEGEQVTRDVAKGYSEEQLTAFFNDPEHKHALEIMDEIRVNGVNANTTAADWFLTMQHTMEKLDVVLLDLADAHLGDDAKKFILEEALKMVFGTLFSLLCSSFIVFWQIRIAANIRRQQEYSRKVNVVVSSFVPKAFLHTMGCRSIMQIQSGQQVNVATTMLFSDIRNFTNLSEKMSNDELFDWLQKYFALMTRVTDRHNGTIDKFIGDAIFAFFPATGNAIKTAIDMQSIVVFLNSSFSHDNLVQLGVGVHHGVVAFGVFGDEQRRSCTMVSSEANLASCLEGLTKQYGVRIICSDAVMEQINTSFFPLDVVNPVDLAEGNNNQQQQTTVVEKRVPLPKFNPDGSFQSGHELGCRFLGSAVMKGSSRVIKIHEVYQSDEVQVRKYKAKCKPYFEEAVRLQEKEFMEQTGKTGQQPNGDDDEEGDEGSSPFVKKKEPINNSIFGASSSLRVDHSVSSEGRDGGAKEQRLISAHNIGENGHRPSEDAPSTVFHRSVSPPPVGAQQQQRQTQRETLFNELKEDSATLSSSQTPIHGDHQHPTQKFTTTLNEECPTTVLLTPTTTTNDGATNPSNNRGDPHVVPDNDDEHDDEAHFPLPRSHTATNPQTNGPLGTPSSDSHASPIAREVTGGYESQSSHISVLKTLSDCDDASSSKNGEQDDDAKEASSKGQKTLAQPQHIPVTTTESQDGVQQQQQSSTSVLSTLKVTNIISPLSQDSPQDQLLTAMPHFGGGGGGGSSSTNGGPGGFASSSTNNYRRDFPSITSMSQSEASIQFYGLRKADQNHSMTSFVNNEVLSLLLRCKMIADEFGVEDPVVAIKLKMCKKTKKKSTKM